MSETHVHDCTGPDATCPCGYKFTVPRFAVSIEVYDNLTKQHVIDDGFSCSDIGAAENALREASHTARGYRQ